MDEISTKDKTRQLGNELFQLHGDVAFKQAVTMGEITQLHLEKILNKPVINWQ
jgi:hypothetical protein